MRRQLHRIGTKVRRHRQRKGHDALRRFGHDELDPVPERVTGMLRERDVSVGQRERTLVIERNVHRIRLYEIGVFRSAAQSLSPPRIVQHQVGLVGMDRQVPGDTTPTGRSHPNPPLCTLRSGYPVQVDLIGVLEVLSDSA